MSGMLRVRRSRGAVSGVLLILLGVWGGLVSFVGPYFHYAYSPGGAWTYTSGRLWLEIAPAIGVIIGGVVLAVSSYRPATLAGGCVAVAGGAWFVVGGLLVQLWAPGITAGTPAGGLARRVVEQVGFFAGLGVAVVFVAALGLGRLSMVAAKDAQTASPEEAAGRRTLARAFRARFGGKGVAAPGPSEEPQPVSSATANE
jgi:hypothetical protein